MCANDTITLQLEILFTDKILESTTGFPSEISMRGVLKFRVHRKMVVLRAMLYLILWLPSLSFRLLLRKGLYMLFAQMALVVRTVHVVCSTCCDTLYDRPREDVR